MKRRRHNAEQVLDAGFARGRQTLAQFVRAEGGIAMSPTGALREIYRRIPVAYRRKRGTRLDVMLRQAQAAGVIGESADEDELADRLIGDVASFDPQALEAEMVAEREQKARDMAEADRENMRSVHERKTGGPVSRKEWKDSRYALNPKQQRRSVRRRAARKRNPQLMILNPATNPAMRAAVARYREFHGVAPRRAVRVGKGNEVLVGLGALKEVVYQPRRGQRRGPAFVHAFGRGAVLAATADGKRLYIVRGSGSRMRVDFSRGILG